MATPDRFYLLRALCLALLVTTTVACDSLDRVLTPATETPSGATNGFVTPADPTATGLSYPLYLGEGSVVSSTENRHLNLQRLSVEYPDPDRLVLRVALYNNSDDEVLSLDPETLLDQGRLSNGTERVFPEKVEVNQGNMEQLIPRSGLIAQLHYRPPPGDRLRFQLPNFPEQPIELGSSTLKSIPTVTPLPHGLWRGGAPVVASHEIPGVAMQVVDLRVRGNRITVNLGFVNTQETAINGIDSSLTGHDLRLIDGQGLPYRPSEVEPALAESLAPEGEWLPGELHEGLIHFPRPATGPLRLEFPTFPPLATTPAERPVVSLTTETHYPPHDNLPVAIPSPPPLANERLATPVTTGDTTAALERVAASLAGNDAERFYDHFRGEAREQMERWWPGIESSPIRDPEFSYRYGADIRGQLVTNAAYLLFYRLEGDSGENRFMLPVTLDLAREGERWYITRWESDPPVWAQAWEVNESDHFLLLADPAVAEESRTLIEEAESAYTQTAERLEPLQLRDRYVMIVPASEERFRELTERGHETQGVATSRYLISSDRIETNSLSFVLNGAAIAELSTEERRRTIAHELVHLLLAPSTRSYSPAWVVEGTATYFSEEIPWETLREWTAEGGLSDTSIGDLSRLDQFANWSDPLTVPGQYAYSSALVAYLAEEHGEQAYLDFYQGYAGNAKLVGALREALQSNDSEQALDELRLAATQQLLEIHFEIKEIEQLEAAFESWLQHEIAER